MARGRWAGCCSTTVSSSATPTMRKPPTPPIEMNTCGWRAITSSTRSLSTRATRCSSSSDRHRDRHARSAGRRRRHSRCRARIRSPGASNIWTFEPHARHHVHLRRRGGFFAVRTTTTRAPSSLRPGRSPRVRPTHFERPGIRWSSHGCSLMPCTPRMRRQWTPFEAEFGLRLDGQALQPRRRSHAVQPAAEPALRPQRTPARLRLGRPVHAGTTRRRVARRGSAGDRRFRAGFDAHHSRPDISKPSPATRWGFEAYTKRWTTVAPYFDNLLDPLSLTPDLAPDRVRIVPDEFRSVRTRSSACARSSPIN